MTQIASAFTWLATSSHWSGPGAIGVRIGEHLWYTLLAILLASVIAIPAGLAIGHTGRGRTVAVTCSGALRALPSLGLLTLLAISTTMGNRASRRPGHHRAGDLGDPAPAGRQLLRD